MDYKCCCRRRRIVVAAVENHSKTHTGNDVHVCVYLVDSIISTAIY